MKNKNEESQKIYERKKNIKRGGMCSIKILLNYYKNSTRNKKAEVDMQTLITLFISVYTTKNYIYIYTYKHMFIHTPKV